MNRYLRIFWTSFAVCFVGTCLVLGVLAIRHADERADARYKHNVAHYCDGHRGIAKFVSPGQTGVYIVCKDGTGGKVEN